MGQNKENGYAGRIIKIWRLIRFIYYLLDMEDLLNKLIEKGWKPFGWVYYNRFIIESDWDMCFKWKLPWTDWTHSYDYNFDYFKIRELVSKESWLWQFVCENGLVEMYEWFYWQNIFQLDSKEYDYTDYQYWILESSLKDESELEDFLLNNIKVEC